jgi:arabinofuranosyltransferase
MITLSSISSRESGRGTAAWALIVALAVLALLVQAYLLNDVSIDDVGISYRYARHLAEGNGLRWNVDAPPVEGYSNLLWVLILAGVHVVGGDIEIASRILGVLCGAATLALMALLLRRLYRDLPHGLTVSAAFLVALCPVWVMWMVSGLEIGLYGLAAIASVLALSYSGRVRARLLPAALAALILTRPEGIVLAFLIVALGWLGERETSWRQRRRAFALPIMVVILVPLMLVVFRLVYFGYPMPNTVYAKFSWQFPSAGAVTQWVVYAAPFLLIWLVTARAWWRSAQRTPLIAALALVIVQTIIVLPVNPVMNFLHRYLIPFLPLLVLPVPLVISRLARRGWIWGALAGIALVVWIAQGWPAVHDNHAAQRYAARRQRCVVERLASLPDRPRIAIIDAGRIPYWSDLPAIDVWGLCDRRIAHEGFSPEAVLLSAAGPADVYIMSLNTRGEAPYPVFGYDILVGRDRLFQERFRLWDICGSAPGERPASTNRYWFLDYGIFLNTLWAEQRGFRLDAASPGAR